MDRGRFYHKRNRLKHFRVFCHVARLGSITRAAEYLGLGQPTVSQQIRALETELGTRLFERNGPRIVLAAAGKSLYRVAMPLVEGMDGLHENFAARRERVSGTIYIAAGEGAVTFILPRIIHRFRERHPDVWFHIVRSDTARTPELVRTREQDIFFSGTKLEPTGLDRYLASSYNLALIVPLDHPLAGRDSVELEEIAPFPAIVPAAGTQSRQMGERTARQLGIEIDVAVETHGWGTIKRYVESGLGVSIVPDFCVTEQDRLSVIPLSRHFRERGYWMYARRDGTEQSPAIERFIRFVTRKSPPPPPPPPRNRGGHDGSRGIDEGGEDFGAARA